MKQVKSKERCQCCNVKGSYEFSHGKFCSRVCAERMVRILERQKKPWPAFMKSEQSVG